MIKINLAAKKRPVSAGGKGGSQVRLDASQMRAVLAQLQEFPLKRIAAVVIVGFIANFASSSYKDQLVAEQTAELDKINAEKPKLEAETQKMKGLQELQKSMDADSALIRSKLEVIKKLVSDRSGAPALLQELSRVTPPNVWMSEFSIKGSELSFKGYSQDFGNISDFTKMIQNSTMFTGMNLKDTQISLDDQKRQVASFSLTARKR